MAGHGKKLESDIEGSMENNMLYRRKLSGAAARTGSCKENSV